MSVFKSRIVVLSGLQFSVKGFFVLILIIIVCGTCCGKSLFCLFHFSLTAFYGKVAQFLFLNATGFCLIDKFIIILL